MMANPAAVKRMPTVVDLNLLPDLGRMNGRSLRPGESLTFDSPHVIIAPGANCSRALFGLNATLGPAPLTTIKNAGYARAPVVRHPGRNLPSAGETPPVRRSVLRQDSKKGNHD